MATVITTDTTSASLNVQIDDKSQLAQSKLQTLIAPVTAIVADLSNPLDQAKCKSAALNAKFTSQSIDTGSNQTLTIKAGTNASLGVYQESDHSLFGKDEYAPTIAIGKGQAWMSFELDTTFDIALNQNLSIGSVSGFGVGVEGSTAAKFTTYTLFEQTGGALPAGKECIAAALQNFKIPASSQDVRNQKPGTVYVCDISGCIKFSGSYSVPMTANSLCLASSNIPVLQKTLSVDPELVVKLEGSVALSGDYSIRFHRISDVELQAGVYKQKQTEFKATFEAAAGITAETGTSDLISKVFNVIAPKVNPKDAGLKEEDCAVIEKALKESIDHSFSVCTNVACSASFGDEAAFVYTIDLSQNNTDTDAALEALFRGEWSLLQKLPNAKELRNVIGETTDRKFAITVNLLGILNYESLADFVGSCMVLHNPEDGTITVTDRETANRISVTGMPYLAADDRLRAVLNQACVATMTYTAAMAGGKLNADLKFSQSLLIYKAKLAAKPLHKDLLTGIALRLMSQEDWQNLTPANPAPQHVRIAAKALYDGNAALQLFFSDTQARTPRKLEDIKLLGRRVLVSLLDQSDPVDLQRLGNLDDDTIWAQMDSNQWTPDLTRLSYPDWYDITFWAQAVADVAPALKAALDAVEGVPAGEDPSTNSSFMKARGKLADAIGAATRNLHAAYEAGWPIAVMCTLSGFKAAIGFEAAWDGQTYVNKQSAPAIAAAI